MGEVGDARCEQPTRPQFLESLTPGLRLSRPVGSPLGNRLISGGSAWTRI